MRKTLFALPLLASALILPRAAHADTITFSVSVIGSGSFGDTVFTDKRVTITESQPAELVTEGVIESNGTPSSFGLCFEDGSTVTVQGLGTSGGPQQTCVFHNFTQGGDYYIADGDGGLFINVPLDFDSFQSSVGPVPGNAFVNFDFCDDLGDPHPYPCPPYFADLTLTSYEANTGIAALIVTSSTPEPSTFVLLATGLLGVGSMLRRGRSINP
jgi:PEP-CTERM motif